MKDLSNENVIHVKKGGIEYLQFRKLLEHKEMFEKEFTDIKEEFIEKQGYGLNTALIELK